MNAPGATATYAAIARMAFSREAFYRFELLFTALRAIVFVLVLSSVWGAVYGTRPAGGVLGGMTLEGVIVYTCVAASLTMIFDIHLEREIGERLRSGNLALQLLKPVNYLLYGFAEGWGTMAYTALFSGVPTLAFLFALFGAPEVSLLQLAAAVPAVLLGFTLFFAFCHLTALTTFFTVEVWGVEALRATIVRFLAGGFLPLSFFPEPLASVAIWLPFPYMIYFPARALTGQLTTGDLVGTLVIQLSWCVALGAANLGYWKLLERRVTIYGG